MTATVVGAIELTRLILANRTEIVAAEGDVVGLAAGSPHRGIVIDGSSEIAQVGLVGYLVSGIIDCADGIEDLVAEFGANLFFISQPKGIIVFRLNIILNSSNSRYFTAFFSIPPNGHSRCRPAGNRD